SNPGSKLAAEPARPTHPATTVRLFSPDYRLLLRRSVFAMGGLAASARPSPAPAPPAVAARAIAKPMTFALKGIAQEDLRFTAFVEDTTARSIVKVRVGDVLGIGRI